MNEKFDIINDDKIIKKFNVIEDNNMRRTLFNYCSKVGLNKTQIKYLGSYLKLYSNIKLDSLEWENLCDIVTHIDTSTRSCSLGLFTLNFFKYLSENGLYKNPNMEIMHEITNYCNKRNYRLAIFNKNANLENFIICHYIDALTDGFVLIDTKLNNKFLVKLLDEYYKSDLFSPRYRCIDFARKFSESYEGFSSFESVEDFNYQVFNKQFDFYKDNKTELKALIKFYIYLHSLDNNIFKPTDPIDIIWMRKSGFLTQYEDGFRAIDINPLEPVPNSDKWIIRPNGQEDFTTKMNSTNYIAIDFTNIHYNSYRLFAKDYFWKSTSTLPTRQSIHYSIVYFLNFIYEYKQMYIDSKNGIDYMTITTKEVFAYLSHIKSTDSCNTFNTKIGHIKKFLKKDYFNVAPMAFEYLVQTANQPGDGGKSIPDDELKKLDKHLLKLAQDNNDDIFYIYYTIFHLALNTNFRINYLLSITTDSIKEGMKKGQYYIEGVTKTSNHRKVKENISKYAHRYLNISIEKTKYLRENAIEKYKNYIFLHYSKNGYLNQIQPISAPTFNTFLKQQCKAIGLYEYTAENLRDTSITKALDFAQENDLSYPEIEILVRGKRSTKIKHYFDAQESKLFVEATYNIIIGDVDLKGQILETTDSSSFTKGETVDDNCGFCKEEECRILKEIGCPMCNYFIVTLDRIPFYKRKIDKLDESIENEPLEHEREHLLAIKRIYAAYLAELYKLKEELERKTKKSI